MERYITDTIYGNTEQPGQVDVELAIARLNTVLADSMEVKDYLPIETELNRVHSMVEKEWFNRGFVEGIRFLLKCI